MLAGFGHRERGHHGRWADRGESSPRADAAPGPASWGLERGAPGNEEDRSRHGHHGHREPLHGDRQAAHRQAPRRRPRRADGPGGRRPGPVEATGRCQYEASVDRMGGTTKPSHRPARRPPTWAALSIRTPSRAPNPKPMMRLRTTRKPIWLMIARPRRSRTGRWTRLTTTRMPQRPKIAPEAPTLGAGPPKVKLAAEAAAAVRT